MPPIARGRHSLQPYDMWTNHSRNQKHHLHRHHHQLYFQIPFPALLFTSPTPNLVQSCDGLPLVCLHDSSKQHNSLAMVAVVWGQKMSTVSTTKQERKKINQKYSTKQLAFSNPTQQSWSQLKSRLTSDRNCLSQEEFLGSFLSGDPPMLTTDCNE